MTESNVPPPPPPVSSGPMTDYASPATDMVAPASKDEQNMGLLMFILGIFTGFLGPLILWLVKKNESRYLDAQGKEVLNFQITVILAMLVNIPLWFIIIGVFIHLGLLITMLVLMIMGAVAASKGIFYRFPFALRLLK